VEGGREGGRAVVVVFITPSSSPSFLAGREGGREGWAVEEERTLSSSAS